MSDNELHEPFPLTDTQQAYLLGRTDLFELGNVTTHAYFEFAGELDVDRFGAAWRRLIERHDMLRAVVLPATNHQQVLAEPPPWSPEVIDLRGAPAEEVAAELADLRQRLSHEVRAAEVWPLFSVAVARLTDSAVHVAVGIDALVCDYASWHVLYTELSAYYDDLDAALPPLRYSFREYVLAEERLADDPAHRQAEAYWMRRVATLPPAPRLPLVVDPAEIRQPRFVRRAAELDETTWAAAKSRAAKAGLTPSALLLAVFAEVLTAWSASAHFTINVPRMNRQPLHPDVGGLIGEFASFSLLEVDNRAQDSFVERAKRLQRQLWQDLQHSECSGVRVLRELMRLRGGFDRALMPVVLTSTLAWAGGPRTTLRRLLTQVYGVSQTPQVYLDVQVDEQAGQLLYNFDAVAELFPDGLLDDMFDTFRELLADLARDEAVWARRELPLPEHQRRHRVTGPAEATPLEPAHEPFRRQAQRRPDQPAVITGTRTLSYEQVYREATQVAHWLHRAGARRDAPVAVLAEKGWEQVVAVYGTLFAGAPYLPLDPAAPDARIHRLLALGEVELVLTTSKLRERLPDPSLRVLLLDDPLPDAPAAPPPVETGAGDLLYVLYTSGSTGEPKGVMIEHGGMSNALRETVERFGIGAGDRCLGLTALHHDMSAFDLLGILGAGGTLVLPDADGTRDASHWAELIERHGITVWNSVPAMADMLLEHLRGRGEPVRSLRLAFLGGDWIPLHVPRVLAELANGIQVVSVGGPTETTLWNIWYPIERVDPGWRSVPYGTPIAGTRYHVLSDELRERPDWVVGEMYCSGPGLARGYWKDPELTARSFITHPVTGERLYRTGDLGRYLPDGVIEFIGRADDQVQLRGQRVEPAEIEAALVAHPSVSGAVVVAVPYAHRPGHRSLAAYTTPASDAWPQAEELRDHLAGLLPAHLVPQVLRTVDHFPLTPNGKVDRAALRAMGTDEQQVVPADTERGALEELLTDTWSQVLGVPVGTANDFFRLGGDSLQMTQVLTRLQEVFEGEELPVRSLLSTSTVAGMAAELRAAASEPGRLDVLARIYLDVRQLTSEEVDDALAGWRPGASGLDAGEPR